MWLLFESSTPRSFTVVEAKHVFLQPHYAIILKMFMWANSTKTFEKN